MWTRFFRPWRQGCSSVLSPGKQSHRSTLQVEKLEDRLAPFSNGILSVETLFGTIGLGPPEHEAITHEALDGILKPYVVNEIIGTQTARDFPRTGNVGLDVEDATPLFGSYRAAHHFDGSAFQEGSAFINDQYHAILQTFDSADAFTNVNPDGIGLAKGNLADLFGKLTHTAQDFYAHSNWVETINVGAILPGTLIDNGNSFWTPLLPFTEILTAPGVVVVEGTHDAPLNTTNPNGTVVSLHREPTLEVTVTFQNGVTQVGIISGDFKPDQSFTPPSVAVPHDDTSGMTGLNKDRPARLGFDDAYALAVSQTKHELDRLFNLVKTELGEESLDELICQWVRPDQVSAVRTLLGLPAEDSDSCSCAASTTIASGSPVDIPLGTVHVGDTISLTAVLTTSDPNENGEGEPLIIQSSGGFSRTLNTYSQQQAISFQATQDGETLSAFIQGYDADESATVCASVNGVASQFSQAQKDAFAQSSTDLAVQATRLATLSTLTDVAGNVVSLVPSPGAITALVDDTLGIVSAGLGFYASYLGRRAVEYNNLAQDPPDYQFTTVAQPTTTVLTLTADSPGAAQPVLDAFNALFLNQAQFLAVADALNTALNRASGAAEAGDRTSQALQIRAVRQFSIQLAALQDAEPALRSNLQAALQAFGFTGSVTTNDAHSFQGNILANGLPAVQHQFLTLSGADTATVASITALLGVQDNNAVAADLPEALTDPAALTALQQGSQALRSRLDPNTAYVQALYLDLLSRLPESAGLAGWLAVLAGGASRDQVAAGIYNSAEHRGIQVEAAYRHFLNRASDPAGKVGWINALLAGLSEEQLSQGFLSSTEYRSLYPSSNDFIHSLSRNVLRRDSGQTEHDGLIAALNQQSFTPTEIALVFLTSPENRAQVAEGLYERVLRRPGDPAGLAGWVEQLISGSQSQQTEAIAFYSSGEYFAAQ